MVWVLVVVLVIVAAAAVLFALKERRSRALKQDFGPEYQRTVQEHGDDRRSAERELKEREARHSELEIRELDPADRDRYADRWQHAQRHFVDEPVVAVGEADGLVREGEPWERTETSDISGGQTLTFKKRYEYLGTVTKGGKTLDKIGVKALDVTLKMDPNVEAPAKITKSDLKVESSDGTILFDREAGTAVEHDETYRVKGDMTIVIKINGEDKELPSKIDLTIGSATTLEKPAK